VDPDGRWIPGLDDDGKVTYTAEKGDNYDSFVSQFSCGGKGKEIFAKAGLPVDANIKAGSIIKGDLVKKVTGKDVLKGNWINMTANQKASQIMFAINYGEQHKTTVGSAFAVDLSDFISGFSSGASGLNLYDVYIPGRDRKMTKVNMSIAAYSVIESSDGKLPVFYYGNSYGGDATSYQCAKNPNARKKMTAVTVTPVM